MENLPKMTEQKQQSCEVLPAFKLPIKQAPEGQQAVAVEIYNRFHAMKTYGKEPESLDGITRTLLKDLADFPAEKILKAFSVHATRSQEFPTTCDIVGLIKRNGRPPLKESDVIAVRKKDGEDRTQADWQLLREWEAQQREGFEEDFSEEKQASLISDNARMRTQIQAQQAEIERLGRLVNKLRFERNEPQGLASPMLADKQTKIQRTLDFMRQTNTPESDIKQFALEHGVTA